MTETVSSGEVVISAETMPVCEKIVERRTVVYETRVDPTVVRIAGERIKDKLFTRFGFLKPEPEQVQFVSMEKYYEPFMVISGKYFIDYYRNRAYAVKLDREVLEVILLDHEFEPEQTGDSSEKGQNVINLNGEERLMNEIEASVILDRYGQDIKPEKLPSAPSERNPQKILDEFDVEEIDHDADLDVLRFRVVKRPKDASRVVNELFELSERVVIYSPRFRIVYRNVETGVEKIVEFDGVTAERIPQSKYARLPIPPPP